MNEARTLRKLRGLSWTLRWNFHPRSRQESVAEHSYWVSLCTLILCDLKNMDVDLPLRYALLHDAEEAITGDLPALVKRGRSWKDVEAAAQIEIFGRISDLSGVAPETKKVVKMADCLAALLFADEEVETGNRAFDQIRAELIYVAYQFRDAKFDELLEDLGFREVSGREPITEMSHL